MELNNNIENIGNIDNIAIDKISRGGKGCRFSKQFASELAFKDERDLLTTNYLLACIAEECSEVSKEAIKGIRFGLHDKWADKPTAHDALIDEFYDLYTIMELLFDRGILQKPSAAEIEERVSNKVHRISKYMKYSANCGQYMGDII